MRRLSPSSGSCRLRPIASSTAPNDDGGSLVGEALHRFDAVLFQDPLHAADGVALAVEQPADALEQIDVVGPVITPPAASLHRLDLGEPRLPKPQHVLGNVEFVSDLADGTERIRRLVQMLAPLNSLVGEDAYYELLRADRLSVLPSPLATAWPLIRCFRIADGLNTITRRGEIGTSVPVFGLRPIR